jgi:hypothetical protein
MEGETRGQRLIRAVQEHRVVELTYQGHQRTVEPHIVGLHEAGEPVLYGYQIGGTSRSGSIPGWRTLIVTEIEDLELTDQRFPGPRGDFDPAGLLEVFARA